MQAENCVFLKEDTIMKRKFMSGLGLCAAILCLMLAGCSKKQDSSQTSETKGPATLKVEEPAETIAVETAAAKSGEDQPEGESAKAENPADPSGLPPFVYPEEDPVMSGICSWMETELGKNYEIPKGGVIIPEPVIYYTDDSDPENVRVWGDFQVDIYTLEGETLVCQSGGSYPGLLHLKAAAAGNHEVTEFEACSDGAGFEEDVRRLFGEAPEEAGDLVAAYFEDSGSDVRADVRKKFLQMYAKQAAQEIHSYQDFGWDPVSLED